MSSPSSPPDDPAGAHTGGQADYEDPTGADSGPPASPDPGDPPGSGDGPLEPKPVEASRSTMTEMIMPNDTNGLGNLMGGRLLHHMDLCAAIVSQRHANRVCVTASVDTVEFRGPIHLGEVVVIEGFVNRAFTSSMEIELRVWAENPREGTRRRCNTAFYTFVGVDEEGTPVPVPPVEPRTEEERERFEAAARRRELRLLMAGRMKAEDASNLTDYLEAAVGAT